MMSNEKIKTFVPDSSIHVGRCKPEREDPSLRALGKGGSALWKAFLQAVGACKTCLRNDFIKGRNGKANCAYHLPCAKKSGRNSSLARWLTPVIPDTQEVMGRKTVVWNWIQ
jgi:hypothetical protein